MKNRTGDYYEFYCDDCGKYLGKSYIDKEDGYFDDKGRVEVSLYAEGRFNMKKYLCKDCEYKFYKGLHNAFQSMGFEMEYNNLKPQS